MFHAMNPEVPLERNRMGFWHQFRLLLWKNFTLKKRSPFVLLFEVFIPLVLFVILLLIRKKQPAVPVREGFYKADPLPSAGVVPIMELFCDSEAEEIRNQYGFREFPKAKTREFLSQLQSVAEHHHFFNPGYSPSEMDNLPDIYKSIIDDPATLHDQFLHANDFDLSSVLQNKQNFSEFLHHNLSLPTVDVYALLNSSVHIREIYRILFGPDLTDVSWIKSRVKREIDSKDYLQFRPETGTLNKRRVKIEDLLNDQDILRSFIQSRIPGVKNGLLYTSLVENKNLWSDTVVRNILLSALGILPSVNMTMVLTPTQIANILKELLLSPGTLHQVACDKNEFQHLLVFNESFNASVLVDVRERLCNLSHHQLVELSHVLQQQISDDTIIHTLHLHSVNLSSLAKKVQEFVKDIDKFYQFQMSLYEMSVFAKSLPQDACYKYTVVTETPIMNVTMTTSNITETEEPEISEKKSSSSTRQQEKTDKKNKFAGFIHLWNVMQRTICGKETKELPKNRVDNDIEHLNFDDLGISHHQRDNLQILIHLLYSNPKVLYAPNNSAADIIIQKANESFALVDLISEYARKWLNVSAELRSYLEENSTVHNLASIKEMQHDLRINNGLLSALKVFPVVSKFLNETIPDIPFFLHELDIIDNAACGWLSILSGINMNVFRGFATEEDMVQYFLTKAYSENVTTVAGVVFENITPISGLPAHVKYKIRQNATFTPTTKYVRNRYWYPGPGLWQHSYYQFGFVWIQDIIERAIIDVQAGKDVVEPGSYVMQFPHSCYLYDQFVFMIEHVMPLCLTISWVYSVSMLVQSIVYEKEQRLKEVMRMMGLSNAVHWFGWFTTTFIQFTITMAILTVMLKQGHVLTYSDPWIVFCTLEVFAIVTIAFSFLVSTFYSKAKVAAACAGIVYFLTYVPYMYVAIREDVAGDEISAVIKSLVSLFSTTAFGLSGKYFAFYEEEGVGVQWNNIHLSPVENDEYSLLTCILMMIMDTFLYTFLAWYIENVFPGSFGLPKPWYFPFTKSYWCGGAMKVHEMDCSSIWELCRKNSGYISLMEEDQACALDQRDADYLRKFEGDPSHLPMGVCIDNLTKVYKTGKKLAVNKLSLNFYEGQITSFLGHNGAGKTTTMSILTGLFPPTSGHALIYGNDIRTEMDLIRQSLGMCPQHNVLFDKLTVEEHLWFYAKLKGMKMEDIRPEMETMIEDVGLPKKRNYRVDCLSGGMQRKLSVAIAFVGGSRTVILDEPTAGVDPYARRAIWDLLVKYKHGRTILLSTHHMDEADILGDRIAIISNGELKCCGSPLFLKNTFGEGYHLYLVKKETEEDIQSIDLLELLDNGDHSNNTFISKCQESKVTEFINKYVSTAFLKSETARELHYILPFEEAKKGNFEKLFDALENSIVQLHISSYGVMDTTLEEVFLKVTENSIAEEEAEKEQSKEMENLVSGNTESHDRCLVDNLSSGTDRSSGEDQSELLSTQASSNISRQDHGVELGTFPANSSPLESNVSPTLSQHSAQEEHQSSIDRYECFGGSGSYKLTGHGLRLNHFRAIIIKRFHYITRNWKGLFSQILLPALFVSIAMTVALSAPKVADPPPIELSPSQYFNVTQPKGNYIPFANEENSSEENSTDFNDARPNDLIHTFRLASGVGATCVLKSPFNSTFDVDFKVLNYSKQSFTLLSKYYEAGCEGVFIEGIHIPSYVPPVPVIINKDSGKYSPYIVINATHTSTVEPHQTKRDYAPKCECSSDNSGFVCDDSYYQPAPEFQVVTRDRMQNITGADTEKFILNTQDAVYRLHRYGAFSFGMKRKCVPENFGKSAPTQFRKAAVRNVAKAWYNHKGYHAMPVFLNTLNNAILRANLPKSSGNPAAYGISVFNHPLNRTNNKLNTEYILQGSDVLISVFIIVAMSFVPASFVVFLVYERSIKAKHLQFVSGIDPVMYWLANYFWDMCNYIIPAFCIIIILLVFHIPAYTSPQNLPAVIALFLLYGWSITPVMYPASFWFKEPSTAYICLIVINLFTGITCIVSSFLLEIFSYDQDLKKIHNIVKDVFLMFPNYCLGRGLMDIAFNEYKNEFYFKTGQYDKMMTPFRWELTTRNLVAMAVVGVCFFLITLLCEHRFFIRRRKGKQSLSTRIDEDMDVATERRRVIKGSGKYDLLRLENLTKVYKTRKLGRHLAVDRLCLGVPAGECFGLLGVNGAGKTTTFRMLTGDIEPSYGDAYLNKNSITQEMLKVQQNLGYCPQFDALYDELTAREHIQLYARLRGIPFKEEKRVVEWALKKLCLTKYADKPSGTYSGGNKRKLSTAIALIGHPPLIFMDEPTTGMDPHSRRFLWDLILNLIKDGRSVILTSHSMEECEVLCTRLAIMVNGQFKCLGSTQHLKNRFGDGYTFTIRLRGPDYERSRSLLIRFIERNFQHATLKEQHYNMLQYELHHSYISLSDLFNKLEEARKDLDIEDYSVSQNNLDNVFINFVKQQVEIVQETEDNSPNNSANDFNMEDDVPLLSATGEDNSTLDIEDDDDITFRIEPSGTRLSLLNMEENI